MAYLPVSVPVFDSDGEPLTTTVRLKVMSLSSGEFFDFSSIYGGSGDDTFKEYSAATSPRITLASVDATNLAGYYTIVVDDEVVPLDLSKFDAGDYLIAAEAEGVDPKLRFSSQIGVLAGRLAEDYTDVSGSTGTNLVTLTVKEVDEDGDPIPNVTVVVRTSTGVLVTLGTTDTNGELEVNLDDGSYNVYLSRAGSQDVYSNPNAIAVTSIATEFEMYGSVGTPDAPTNPGVTRIYGNVVAMGITAQAGISVIASIAYPDEVYTSEGMVISGSEYRTETDTDGYFYLDLIPQKFLGTTGVIYRIEIHEVDLLVEIAASDLNVGGSLSLADLGAA